MLENVAEEVPMKNKPLITFTFKQRGDTFELNTTHFGDLSVAEAERLMKKWTDMRKDWC